ncbi:MAG: thioredoxin family protein [Planctomycetaceae bacterium]|nr:thioredoxin family protein [Planctomycetaceae bacterium]
MRTTSFTATLIAATLSLTFNASAADLNSWLSDYDAAQREAQRLDRPMLIHFYTDWCFPCRRMEKEVLSRPTVTQVLESRLILVKLNAERHPEIARRLGVELFPTDVIVDPSGQRILSSTGYQEADKYVRFARDAEQIYVTSRKPTTGSPDETRPSVVDTSIMLAIDGYCPVTLASDRKWVKGDPQHVTKHRGQTYYFADAKALSEFEAETEKFVPQLLGCDAVVLMDTDLAVPGSVKFGAYYDDHLYLFATNENRLAFKAEPERYTQTRVVRNIDEIDRPLIR